MKLRYNPIATVALTLLFLIELAALGLLGQAFIRVLVARCGL